MTPQQIHGLPAAVRHTADPVRRAILWRSVVDQAKRLGWHVACGRVDFPEACANAYDDARRFGFQEDNLHDRLAEIVLNAAEQTSLAASSRVRAAIAPMIQSRARSAAIKFAAHHAAAGDLSPPVIHTIVSEELKHALAVVRRRRQIIGQTIHA